MWQVALVEVKFVTVGSVGAVVLAATRTACDDRLDRALTDADTADAQTVAPPHYSHLNALVMAANLVVTYGMTRCVVLVWAIRLPIFAPRSISVGHPGV
jgi:hypothetical protein